MDDNITAVPLTGADISEKYITRDYTATATTATTIINFSQFIKDELERAQAIQVHPIECKKCGASFEFKGQRGKCPYCGTYYSTQIVMEE